MDFPCLAWPAAFWTEAHAWRKQTEMLNERGSPSEWNSTQYNKRERESTAKATNQTIIHLGTREAANPHVAGSLSFVCSCRGVLGACVNWARISRRHLEVVCSPWFVCVVGQAC